MSIFSKSTNNYLAVALVFMLIILVFFASSAMNQFAVEEPEECKDTSFAVSDLCYSEERTQLDNFHPTIRMIVRNDKADINGFTVHIVGDKGFVPTILFKTVLSGQESEIRLPYESEVSGSVRRIEIMPIVNMNHDLYHCSLTHGYIYQEEVHPCS